MEATTPSSGDTLRSALLSTKMRPPRPRADRLQRPLLVARLRAGLDRPLTLLSAPVGSGKTTLLGEWLQSCDRPVGWLALDAGDNDPLRFLAYLGAALGACDPALGRHIQDQLRAPPAWDVLVAELVNAVAAAQPFVLVLDDYHVITAAPVHALLTGLLEQAPAPLHLAIGTRADPPFPLARLRVRGALTELRAPDLRFTPQEIAALLAGVYHVPVTPAQIARLADRTEGWAAGLQMAALALHGRDDVERFVDRFSGGHQYVLDYLVEEVLVHQPAEIQHFLLRTAILERLCAEVCDAVLGNAEGERVRDENGADGGEVAQAFTPHPSSFILDQLERSNLFLIPLDDERRWYRYHHLFADLLRARLHQTYPGLAATLHRRAADWFREHGLPDQAIAHALAGGDTGYAAGLIAREAPLRLQRGEALTVQRWLAELPDALVAQHPALLATRCWMLWLQGRLGAIEPHLRVLEQAIDCADSADSTAKPAIPSELRAQAALLRAYQARRQGDLPAASAAARHALEQATASSEALRGLAAITLGHVARDAGGAAEAAASFQNGLDALWAAGIATMIPSAALYLAHALLQQGRLAAADAASRTTLRRLVEAGWDRMPQAGAARLALAEVLCEQNELTAAATCALGGLEQCRRGGFHDLIRIGAITLMRVLLAQADYAGARQAWDEAMRAAEASDLPWGHAEVAAAQVRLALAQGDMAAARRGAARLEALAGIASPYVQELTALAAARLAVAVGDNAGAIARLGPALAAAEAAGRVSSALECHALLAQAQAAAGDRAASLRERARMRELAAPLGFERALHDDRPPIGDRRKDGEKAQDDRAHAPALDPLIEPLSERELEVLRLLAQGRSNRAIAAALVISEGTVKSHIHHIYGKLAARSRVEAIVRARELNLL